MRKTSSGGTGVIAQSTNQSKMAERRKLFDRDTRDRESYHGSDGGKLSRDTKYDDPPNSRLFIVCGKTVTEEDFRESFEKYGTIEEIWVVKTRTTGEPKGVAYIKFSKTSEAALAMEEMNGRCIGSHPRPLKVLIAHSRDQGSRRDMNEEERLLRLFVVVPKSMTEKDVREQFAQFGDIDYVSIVKDRVTKESKGFAYIKYHRPSHAAKAFEGCDRSFKPVFAEPKPQKSLEMNERFNGPQNIPKGVSTHDNPFHHYDGVPGCGEGSFTRLEVIASPQLNWDQLWRLFDLIPGLDYCHLHDDPKNRLYKGHATVVYNTPQSAAYAKEKLHGFEYPPGQRLIVKPDYARQNEIASSFRHGGMHSQSAPFPRIPPSATMHSSLGSGAQGLVPSGDMGGGGGGGMPLVPPHHQLSNSAASLVGSRTANLQTDLVALVETIAQATSLIQAAGLSGVINKAGLNVAAAQGDVHGISQLQQKASTMGETYDPAYCSAKLPPPQPLAPIDSEVALRLFIVCQPTPPPMYALKDVFGRFGNLIDVYILSWKSCGYAKYASKESAENAIATLHGQEICGSRMKVMPAEPNEKADSSRKRIKVSVDDE